MIKIIFGSKLPQENTSKTDPSGFNLSFRVQSKHYFFNYGNFSAIKVKNTAHKIQICAKLSPSPHSTPAHSATLPSSRLTPQLPDPSPHLKAESHIPPTPLNSLITLISLIPPTATLRGAEVKPRRPLA